MIALVRGLSAGAICSAPVISVSRSTSTKTGVAPNNSIRFVVDTHVIEGVITSSPGPMPSADRVRCMPAVPELTATQCVVPICLANNLSNSVTLGPVVIQPERNTSVTAAISASPTAGRQNGMNSFDIIFG